VKVTVLESMRKQEHEDGGYDNNNVFV